MTNLKLATAVAVALILSATLGVTAPLPDQLPDRNSATPWVSLPYTPAAPERLHRHGPLPPARDARPPHRYASGGEVVGHPAGCPRVAFCGCGASVEVFGHSVRELWLASAWLRFPRAALAAGMAVVTSHHVFIVREVRGPGLVLAYDANSGGHQTRVHLRRVVGVVVNPHGGRA